MKSLVTLALTVAVAGCGLVRNEPAPPPRPTPEPTPVNVTLTAQAATASIPIPHTTTPSGMRVTVVSLSNPAAQGLLINATLTSPDGRLADLGTFSPYPIDKPGSSAHLRLPIEGTDIAAGPATLVLQMTALPAGAQINPDLTITLAVAPTSG